MSPMQTGLPATKPTLPIRGDEPSHSAPGNLTITELGEIATAYFKRFATKSKHVDTTIGIHSKGGRFCIENIEVSLDGDAIIVGDGVYEGTPGLWEVIFSKSPSDEIYTVSDKEKYTDNLTSTNALNRNNNLNAAHPK
jgi:hypothetical protein